MARFLSVLMVLAGLLFSAGNLQAVEILRVNVHAGYNFCQYRDGDFSIQVWQYRDTELYPYPTSVTTRPYEAVEWVRIEFTGNAVTGEWNEPVVQSLPRPSSRGWGWNPLSGNSGRMKIKNGISAILSITDRDGVHRFFFLCEDGVLLLTEDEMLAFFSGLGLQFFLDVKAGHAVSMSMVFDILGSASASKPTAAVGSASWGSVKSRFSLGGEDQLRIIEELFK